MTPVSIGAVMVVVVAGLAPSNLLGLLFIKLNYVANEYSE